MVVLPVFIQAPWVHFNPLSALVFSVVIFSFGLYLIEFCDRRWWNIGSLLIGVSWSWLGGCLFWGWLRSQPVWHLPVEAIVFPLACVALKTRWRIGASFYLASLLGTAFTDLMILLTGVMKSWPQVVQAPFSEATNILSQTAEQLLKPASLVLIFGAAALIMIIAIFMRQKAIPGAIDESAWLVASAALTTTLWVDGLFFLTTLIQPQLSGLI